MLYKLVHGQWTLVKEGLPSLPKVLRFIDGKLIQLELKGLEYYLHIEEEGDVNIYKFGV